MQFEETLRARHSVRLFKNTPVAVDALRAVVADAQMAPSWVNAQEWKVWIAMGKTLEIIRKEHSQKDTAGVKGYGEIEPNHRDSFSKMAQDNMAAFVQSRIDAGLGDIKVQSQAELFHAPAVIYLTLPKTFKPYTLFDLGGFEQTLMLAAADRGLGTVTAYNLIKYPDLLHKHLGIPETEAIVIGIAIGYEEKHALNDFRSKRRSVDDILTIRD